MIWQASKLNSSKAGAKRSTKRYGLGMPMFSAMICRVTHRTTNSVAAEGPPR